MLSFEWQTQGRPLNSFIVGFKTLHFKKYKSYSQMNEGEGDWREGLLMCPIGRHELNPSPQAAQFRSPARWQLCPDDPALHTLHPFGYFRLSPQCSCIQTVRAVARGRSRQTLDKPSVCDSHNLFCNSHLCYKFPALSPHTARVTFLCLDTLERKWILRGQSLSI